MRAMFPEVLWMGTILVDETSGLLQTEGHSFLPGKFTGVQAEGNLSDIPPYTRV